MKPRNSLIELLRFLCASAIIMGHLRADCNIRRIFLSFDELQIRFFQNSSHCVEFFFVVTGFLLANTCYRKQDIRVDITDETKCFIWQKARRIFPYYITANLGVVILKHNYGEKWLDLFWKFPSFFFLHKTGIVQGYVSVSWYISSMFIAMVIVYPLCLKYYYQFTQIIAPFSALIIIGSIIRTTGHLGGIDEWAIITYKCNFRAIAEISLGTTCYEISRRIKEYPFSTFHRILLSLSVISSIIIVGVFVCSNISQKNGGAILILIAVVVIILFSQAGVLRTCKIYNNRLFNYMGSISLPMYLMQNVFRELVKHTFTDFSNVQKVIFVYTGTVASSFVLHYIVENRGRKRLHK